MKIFKITLVTFTAMLICSATAPAATITHAGPETFVGTTPDKVDLIGDLGKTGIDIGIAGSISFDYQFSAAAYYDVMVYATQGADWSAQIRTNNGSGWHIEMYHWDGASNSSALPAATWDIATVAHDLAPHSFSLSWTDGGTIDLLVDGGALVNASTSYAGVGAGILPGITDQIILGGSTWNPGDAEEYDGTISNIVITDMYSIAKLTIVETSGSTQVEEGGATDSFTVQLISAPTDTVTVTLDPDTDDIQLDAELPGDPYALTFTTGNWNSPQTVLVTANNDVFAEGSENVLINISITSADVNFNNKPVLPITVNVIDSEATIVMHLPETSFDGDGGTLPDTVNLGDIDIMQQGTFTMDFKVPVWTGHKTELLWGYADADYLTEVKYSARIIIDADDTDPKIGVTFRDQGDGETPTYPTISGNVEFPNDGGWHTLRFSWTYDLNVQLWVDDTWVANSHTNPYRSANGNTNIDHGLSGPGTHMIGDDPLNGVPSEKYTGQIRNLIIADKYYASLITVAHSSGSTDVDEESETSDSFTVKLASAPADTVTITLDPDTGDINLESELPGGPYDLTFTTGSWNVAQTVTVTAYDDVFAENMESVLISISSVSNDADFDDQGFLPIVVSVTDNDVGDLAIVETNGSTDVAEEGPTMDVYTVALAYVPTASVTVDIADVSNPDEVSVSPGQLTFTTGNWSVPQTVTVTAIDDDQIDPGDNATVSHTTSSSDGRYQGLVKNVTVNITDNEIDTPPFFTGLGLSLNNGGGAWGDIDNDGWVDLFDGDFWYNTGNGTLSYIEFTQNSDTLWSDFDNDGDLDMVGPGAEEFYTNQGPPSYNFVNTPAFPAVSYVGSFGGCLADFDEDGFIDVYASGYEETGVQYYPDALIMNNGSGTAFTKVWEPVGLPTRGVTSCDWDEDGDMDIYVSHYRLVPNKLFENDGSGNGSASFTDVTGSKNATGGNAHTIGSVWGDIDNDGDFDLFVCNFAHPAPGQPGQAGQPESVFLSNDGSPLWGFSPMGEDEIGYQEAYASPSLADYDNDGDLDLWIGYATGYAGAPRLYRNDGGWNFTDVTSEAGLSVGATSGAAWADFDHDGDLDLMTAGDIRVNSGSSNHWFQVHLESENPNVNRSAIGAQVRIVVPGLGTLSRQVEAGSGVNNQNDLTLHFGLGNYTGPLALEIFWPDGFTSQHSASVDTSITIAYPLVSLVEFNSFANEWLNTNCNAGNNWCNGYDYDQNQSVDIDDLNTFAADKWLSY